MSLASSTDPVDSLTKPNLIHKICQHIHYLSDTSSYLLTTKTRKENRTMGFVTFVDAVGGRKSFWLVMLARGRRFFVTWGLPTVTFSEVDCVFALDDDSGGGGRDADDAVFRFRVDIMGENPIPNSV